VGQVVTLSNLSRREHIVVLATLVVCQIGLHINMHGMRVAIPLEALAKGYSAFMVGFLVAMFAIVPALLAIAFGRFTDRCGYHLPVRLAAALSLVAGLCLAMSDSLLALCIGAACSGAGSGFGMIAIQRTASKMASSAATRLQIFSWIAIAPSLAGLIGPLLAGVMIDQFGYRQAFAILAIPPLVTLFLSQRVPREELKKPLANGSAQPRRVADILRILPVRRLLFINWAVVASWDVHGFVVPILGHKRGFSATEVGAIFAAFGLASIVVRLLLPLFVSRLSRKYLLLASLGLAALSLFIYPFLELAWMISICAFSFGVALGSVQPAILATLHEVTPSERHGETLAVRSMFTQGSMLAMPLLYGAVGASLGAALLLWGMVAALSAASWQVIRLYPRSVDLPSGE